MVSFFPHFRWEFIFTLHRNFTKQLFTRELSVSWVLLVYLMISLCYYLIVWHSVLLLWVVEFSPSVSLSIYFPIKILRSSPHLSQFHIWRNLSIL